METETFENQRSDIVEWTKQTRKISINTRQQANKVSRKISNAMTATDAFKEGFQHRIGNERPSRKTSLNWANFAEDKPNKSSKFQPKMENTYQLEPQKTFPCCAVQTTMSETLQRHLEGMEYDDPGESSHKAKIICEDIKSKVKAMNLGRYRIVCLVHIGCNTGQELKIVSRSLWNPLVDTFVTADFRSKNLFAVATVFGVYFE